MANHISYDSKIKQKRGKGVGKNYKPWYKVGEVNQAFPGQKSRGNGHRINGLKSKRVHHLLSDAELMVFMVLDLNRDVSDIREQFPLLDIELAKRIATELGIKYPNHTENHILTSDFFIEFKNGEKKVITVKPISKINKRQLELFQIERVYWQKLGIGWELMTDKDIPTNKTLLMNYGDIYYSVSSFNNKEFELSDIQNFYTNLITTYEEYGGLGIVDYCNKTDSEMNFEPGLSLRILKVLLGRKIIQADLNESIFANQSKLNSIKILSNVKHIDKSDLAA